MKYSHIGILKNRSLLTTNPFNPLKNKIVDLIQNEIETFNNLIKNNEVSNNFLLLHQSISVEELTKIIHSLKTKIYKSLEDDDLKYILINDYKIEFFNETTQQIKTIDYIKNSITLNFINKHMPNQINLEIRNLLEIKELLEKIRLFKSNLNQVKLAERYYENANNMKDENLKLNLYYYFNLNFVKAYTSIQYYQNKNVKDNFDRFEDDIVERYFDDYIKQLDKEKKSKNYQKFLKEKNNEVIKKIFKIRTLNKKIYFKDLKHGLSYKFNELKYEASIETSIISKSNFKELSNSLFDSAWFYFFMTDSKYTTLDELCNTFKPKFFLDNLIFSIIEFKSLHYMFDVDKLYEKASLEKYDEKKLITFFEDDQTFIKLDLNFICSKKVSDLNPHCFYNSILSHLDLVESDCNFKDNVLIIPLNLFKQALINKYKLQYNSNDDLNIDILSVLCEIANNLSKKSFIKNEYILTKSGYSYYLKIVEKDLIQNNTNNFLLMDLNMSRYLFLYFLSNEVRYQPNLLIEDSPSLKKYEYLKKEAGSILPKQFLYDAVSKILQRPLAIPFSDI